MAEQHGDRLAELEEQYAGYEVYDRDGEKIGKVDHLFVDENDKLEYIGVKMGLLGTRSVLIPMDAARVDEGRRVIEVSQPRSNVEEGPAFNDAGEVTPGFEEQVRSYYRGGGDLRTPAERDVAEEPAYTERVEDSERPPDIATGDVIEETGEVQEPPAATDREEATRRETGSTFVGYQVYDRHYEKIGKVDDIFVDENGRPEYIGVKMGLLGTRSTLIPMDIVRVNDRRQLVEVEANKDAIKEGPTFGDDREITVEFEQRVLNYYEAETERLSAERGVYGPYSGATGDEQVDVQPGERAGDHEHLDERQPEAEVRDVDREPGSSLAGEDELGPRPPEPRRPAEPERREEMPADRPPVEEREPPETRTEDDATRDSR